MRPVFTVLNKKILSFFEGEHVTNLYSSVRLSKVLQTFQPGRWNVTGLFCFEITKNPTKDDRLIGGAGKPTKVGVCAQNYEKMKSWMESIEKFENCEIEEYVPEAEGDEQTVKSSVQVRKVRNENKAADNIAKLEAEASKEEENAEKEKQEQEAEMSNLRDKLKVIKSEMTKKNIEDQRDRLRLMEERNRQENLRDFLRREEDCLDEDLNKKAEDGASKAEEMIRGVTNIKVISAGQINDKRSN